MEDLVLQQPHFLADTAPLAIADAAAALIVVPDGRYLMQLRDEVPGIFYPGYWGCFGGGLSPGEAPLVCMKRELREELELELAEAREFMCFSYDLTPSGGGQVSRVYYEVPVTELTMEKLVLHEGAAMKLFAPAELFSLPRLAPYDAFALWLHFAGHRLR